MLDPSPSLIRFNAFKQRVLEWQRIAGIYILEAAEVPPQARHDPDRHAFMCAFTSQHGFSPPDVGDAEWKHAEVFREDAREQLVESLVGGSAIGHSRWDVPPEHAMAFAADFLALFGEDARFYCSVNPTGPAQILAPYGGPDFSDFIYGGGCVAVDSQIAAVFWTLDND